MLVIGNNPNLMALLGLQIHPSFVKNMIILNMSSYNQYYPQVGVLPPPNINFLDQDTFDMQYYQYLFSNSAVFAEFMKVIIPLYKGYNVYLIIGQDQNSELIAESFAKIILARYGYKSEFVNDPEDFLFLDETESLFSIEGLAMLDADKDQYSINQVQNIFNNGGGDIDIKNAIAGGLL